MQNLLKKMVPKTYRFYIKAIIARFKIHVGVDCIYVEGFDCIYVQRVDCIYVQGLLVYIYIYVNK